MLKFDICMLCMHISRFILLGRAHSHDVLNTVSTLLIDLFFLKDVAIAYGFNEIPKRKLPSLKPLPLNQFSDLIRTEVIFKHI